MFLECFRTDVPRPFSKWLYDIHTPCLVMTEKGIQQRPSGQVLVHPLPIKDRLEALAEEMLAKAADLNEPLSKDEILRRYEAMPPGLDVPSNGFLRLRGQVVAVPEPEYLGVFVSGPDGANLILYNLRTVIPVKGHAC